MRFKFNTRLLFPFLFVPIFLILGQSEVFAQTKVFATTVSNRNHTTDFENAVDSDLQTKAVIRANTGTALGIGAYSGQLELKFPATVSANTTSYVKIDADDNLFLALLGGNLGHLIDDILGTVLIGNQEFSIQVLNGTTELLSANSQIDGDFAKPNIRLVVNALNEYFIAVTPNQAYDKIKITNRIGSVLGLNNTKRLNVYGAFYNSSPNECGQAAYTSYDGYGLNLDALNIGGIGVTHPEYAIDANLDNFSELSMGILSAAGSISQTIYFEGLSNINDNYNIRLKLDPSLLTVGVANSIHIIAKNGTNEVANISLSSLLNADLLTLLQGNRIAKIPFSPESKIDRITIKYVSLLNVNLTQRLDFYGIEKSPELPTIASVNLNQTACMGSTANLVATSNDASLELRWYEELESENPLAIHSTGEAFATPEIQGDHTYYVAAGKPGCTIESARVAVHITALATPSSDDILIRGNEAPFCSSSLVVLTPESSEKGIFSWYFDANKTLKITNGLIQNGVTYSIDTNGTLSIDGLSVANAPFNYYVGLTNEKGCSNALGDLKMTSVSIINGNLVPIISLDENTTADDTISEVEASEIIIISGTVSGDAQIGDVINLFINNNTYTTAVKDNYTFEIGVDGSDLAEDDDLTIDALLKTTNGTCSSTAADSDSYALNSITLTVPTVNAQQTNDGTPIITGTADSDDNLTVLVNGINYTQNDGNLVDHGDDTWSLTIPESNALPEGTYDVAVTVSDNDGHTANDATTDELVIEANAVVLTVPTVNAQQTNDSSPIITGTADSDDNLTVLLNGINYTENDGDLVDHGDDTWSLTIPESNALPEGTYDVAVTVSDNDGHTANDATADEILIEAVTSDLTITKTVNVLTPLIGETIVFTITVHNSGETNLNEILVDEQIRDGFTFLNSTVSVGEYNSAQGIWTISQLDINETATLMVTVKVNTSGDTTNTATIISSDPEETNIDNNSDTVTITRSCLTIYNEFSPNNDGANETFKIQCIEQYPLNTLKIFNRYGSLVYSTSSYKNNWKGIANVSGVVRKGEALPSGTYFYVLKIKDFDKELTGWLFLAK